MKTVINYIKSNLIYILLPLIPLIEGLFFEPYWNFKVNGNTFPFLQGIILFFYLFFKRNNLINLGGLILYIILLNIIIFVKYPENFAYIIIIFLSYLLIKERNILLNYEHLKAFVISYSIITVLIYFFRLNQYAFDLIRTRSGSNIYGSNELTGILLILATYSFYSGKIKEKDSIIFIFLFLFFSVLFIRRVSLVASVILLILFLLLKFSRVIFSRKIFKALIAVFVPSVIMYYIFSKFDFFDSIMLRFSSAETNSGSFSGFIEDTSYLRSLLWDDGIKLFKENVLFGIGAGNFKYYSFQSNAHSLFINNLAEFGILFGSLINIIYLIPLLKITISNISISNKILAFSSYLFFLMIANISGINLFQNTGYVSAFSTLGFFFIIKFISKTK